MSDTQDPELPSLAASHPAQPARVEVQPARDDVQLELEADLTQALGAPRYDDGSAGATAPDASLAVLAHGIAHDFNNLLVGVMGNLDLARYADDISGDTRRHLDAALSAAERAAELCRQLLAFSGRGPVRKSVRDVNAELRRLVPLLRQNVQRRAAWRQPSAHPAKLHVQVAPGPLTAQLDGGLFVQLLVNLVDNAVDAVGPDGTITVSSGASTYPTPDLLALRWIDHPPLPGDYVALRVSDDGAGMSEALQQRVFEPLFSTRGDARGLGLPAVAGIVRQHGGCIGLRSAIQRGCEVVVLLPSVPATGAPKVPAAPRSREGTVLILDDEPTVRDVLRLQLERLGYRTHAVENGQLALEYLQAHAGQVLAVVLDQTMPVMGGGEAYRRLRTFAPALPVVMTTGFGEENLLDLIADDAHAAFLPKPFALGRLREVLEQVTAP